MVYSVNDNGILKDVVLRGLTRGNSTKYFSNSGGKISTSFNFPGDHIIADKLKMMAKEGFR